MSAQRLFLLLPALLLVASAASAQDANWNGLDDSSDGADYPPGFQDGPVAIVDTGDGSIANFQDRLDAAGYTHVLIPMNSGYDTLSQYDAVILPVGHGSACCYNTIAANAADYHQYVADAGCLYVCQPNPYNISQPADIPWVPYGLTLNAYYDLADCPPTITDPDHCMAQGLQGSDLPFPADQAIGYDPEWEVVEVGQATGYPGLITAPYGSGHVLVDMGHPSPGALCPYTNDGFAQMMSCCLGPPTPVEDASWGSLKTLYR
jgi:hypothetical protein